MTSFTSHLKVGHPLAGWRRGATNVAGLIKVSYAGKRMFLEDHSDL